MDIYIEEEPLTPTTFHHTMNQIKYPIEDDYVQREITSPHHDNNQPIPNTDFGIPPNYVSDAMMIWNFLYTFCRSFQISPFSFDDFLHAIKYPKPNSLIQELLQVIKISLSED